MSYIIAQILKNKKITDYLASKGHYPKGHEVNGRLRYLCPLHGDSAPSFVVYLNGEYENFFCFGCREKYNIIHLYKKMEGVSTRDAIKALSGDLDIDVENEITHAIQDIESDTSANALFSPPQLALILNRQLYDFLKRVDNSPSYVEKADKIERIIDESLEKYDLNSLQNLYEILSDVLLEAIKKYDLEKESNIKDK